MVGSLEETLRTVVLPPSGVYSIVAPVMGVKPSNPFIQVKVMSSSSYVALTKLVTGAGGTMVGRNGEVKMREGGGKKGEKKRMAERRANRMNRKEGRKGKTE